MAVAQTDSFVEDNNASLEKWKSAPDAIADSDSDRNASDGFDCNICLDTVQDPVVTLCGHLYCWPCIYKWLNHSISSSEDNRQQSPQCPVCKTQVSPSSLVPLYGPGQTTGPSKGKSHQLGPVIPKRPHGPLWMLDSQGISNAATTVSQPATPYHHHNYPETPYHFGQSNSIPGSYTSPMLTMDGALGNAFDTSIPKAFSESPALISVFCIAVQKSTVDLEDSGSFWNTGKISLSFI
ncbi:E3 ubiquitin-protein ligase RMA1H1-like [Senna tora]|uniref:E3 ubiquitin-protein ligase RMA n=1 Tax=Senna tora TaxID=362788 RepID=A0A834SKK0_9FABA|nr:E3 ubiquitin-protein ligase RMA1H1-like [Senna tora]